MRAVLLGSMIALTAGAGGASAQTAGPAPTTALTAEVTAQDAALFAAAFDRCDVAALRELVAEDFEFYHDKWGLNATSGAQWLAGVEGMCERQKQGTDYTARRELLAGSEVLPLNNYGAIHTGTHRFFATSGAKKGKLVEVARFFHVWKKDGPRWRLTRVFSYDHRLAE